MNAPILIDGTTLKSLQRFTGIQRIVLSMAEHGGEVEVLDFSSGFPPKKFSESPKLTFRKRSSAIALTWPMWTRIALALAVVRNRLLGARIGRVFEPFFMLVVTSMYNLLAPAVFKTSAEAEFKAPLPLNLWLFDVPKSAKHIRFLKKEVLGGRIRLHVFLYDLIPINHAQWVGSPFPEPERRKFANYLDLVTKAAAVVCISKFTQDRYLEHTAGERSNQTIGVLYPPRDLFHPRPSSVITSEQRVAVEKSPDRTVLSIAPLNARKNLITLMRAAQLGLERGEKIRFIFLNPIVANVDPDTVRMAFALREKYPSSLSFFSPVSDEELDQLFEVADIVAVPSLLEGFGLPVVDSYLRGKTTIASCASSFRELAEALDCVLVEPLDPEAWLRAILIAKPATKYSARELPNGLFPSGTEFIEKLLGVQRESTSH